jgi:hypothetical protein
VESAGRAERTVSQTEEDRSRTPKVHAVRDVRMVANDQVGAGCPQSCCQRSCRADTGQ